MLLKIRLVWDWWCGEISRRQIWIALAWLMPCVKSVDLSVAIVSYSVIPKNMSRGKCPNSNVCSCLPGCLSNSLRIATFTTVSASFQHREQSSWWRHGVHEVVLKDTQPNTQPFHIHFDTCAASLEALAWRCCAVQVERARVYASRVIVQT